MMPRADSGVLAGLLSRAASRGDRVLSQSTRSMRQVPAETWSNRLFLSPALQPGVFLRGEDARPR